MAAARPSAARFSLVFLDIVMPQVSGDRLARALRGRGVDAPLVAVTGNVSPVDISRYASCGFSAVLGKPVDRDSLMEMLNNSALLTPTA